jgi:hypothetical protein
MQMNPVRLDLNQLLGFKIAGKPESTGADRWPATIGAKIGDKTDVNVFAMDRVPAVTGAKIGAKAG